MIFEFRFSGRPLPKSKIKNQKSKIPSIALCAGEASGDAYAAALVEQIRLRAPEARFEGIGGPKSRAAGVELLSDSSHWGAIGIVQALRLVPRILAGHYRMKALLRGSPGLFVPIDFGYMNTRLARHAKNHGWRVLYFVPPGSWRRDRQGGDLPKITDAIITPFSWSAEILNRMGANAHWFGHPIKQLLVSKLAAVDPASPRTSLAVLPGSRAHEIDSNLPVLAKALRKWQAPIEFAVAPSLDIEQIRRAWGALTGRTDTFTPGETAAVLLRARAGLICSGTATLEAALCACPMVVFYELSPSMRREGKLIRFKRPRFISLPNILLERTAVPEHAQAEPLDPDVIRADLNQVWFNEECRNKQLEAFDELNEMLGRNDAITRTAELAVSMVAEEPVGG